MYADLVAHHSHYMQSPLGLHRWQSGCDIRGLGDCCCQPWGCLLTKKSQLVDGLGEGSPLPGPMTSLPFYPHVGATIPNGLCFVFCGCVLLFFFFLVAFCLLLLAMAMALHTRQGKLAEEGLCVDCVVQREKARGGGLQGK